MKMNNQNINCSIGFVGWIVAFLVLFGLATKM